jgi:formate-dependent nitrite reductase cytochrome c552 subunit
MRRNNILGLTFVLILSAIATSALALNEECAECHGQRVGDIAASSHNALACESCHEGAASHVADPDAVNPTVHFDLEVCSSCHAGQYGTYVYGDDWKTIYGGSPLLWNKLNDFSHYNDIIDGYGFTREYNEERSHNVMLQDHYDITRGKKETCMQCKSTKLAYYWDSDKERVIENDTFVHAGHMAEGILVPEGTTVAMKTDREALPPYNHEVQVLVTLPGGTQYASFEYPGATKDGLWLWAALYALTVNELASDSPTRLSGNGCNHCHDPHKVARDLATDKLIGFRLIRKSLLDAIDRKGINPYDPASPTVFIDKIDRDYFPWAKAYDLEDDYSAEFPGWGDHLDKKYIQDWVHGTGGLSSPNSPGNGVSYLTPSPIQTELIKSQHPEAETYWESRHYGNDAECFVCHMPKVTRANDGTQFTSHWLASPLKYMTPEPVATFAAEFGLEVSDEGIIPPCGACHGGRPSRMKDKAERIQNDTYADALTVETALVSSLVAIKTAKDALVAGQPVSPVLLETALDDHRAAHVRWENLVVSENSMGFHNPSEVGNELSVALNLAESAEQNAQDGTDCGPGCGPAAGFVPDGSRTPGSQLAVTEDAAGDLMFSWGGSCISSDTDFAIYEGTLGDFTSHAPLSCSTGGATSAVLPAGSGSTYYLVLPHNTIWEGSHGYRSNGTERPRGASVCYPQGVGVCE